LNKSSNVPAAPSKIYSGGLRVSQEHIPPLYTHYVSIPALFDQPVVSRVQLRYSHSPIPLILLLIWLKIKNTLDLCILGILKVAMTTDLKPNRYVLHSTCASYRYSAIYGFRAISSHLDSYIGGAKTRPGSLHILFKPEYNYSMAFV
jgi:hypothetical protein